MKSSKRVFGKKTDHARHIHLDGDMNNNKMERFNGEIRGRAFRGLKKDDSSAITGIKLYHNFIRPHMSLDNDTPAHRAGIEIKGDNKWLAIIQNASLNS